MVRRLTTAAMVTSAAVVWRASNGEHWHAQSLIVMAIKATGVAVDDAAGRGEGISAQQHGGAQSVENVGMGRQPDGAHPECEWDPAYQAHQLTLSVTKLQSTLLYVFEQSWGIPLNELSLRVPL